MTNRGETGGGSEGAQDRPLSRDWRVQRDEVEKQLGRIARADVVTVTIDPKTARPIYTLRRSCAVLVLNFLERRFGTVVGIAFILIATALAFLVSEPTALQTRIILAIFALGGGGFGSEIAGSIIVDLTIGNKLAISAAGAAGIFVILFFAVPAS